MQNYFIVSVIIFWISGFQFQAEAQSHWSQKADYTSSRSGISSFSIGTKGYFSCGVDNSFITYNDLWEYDPINDVWTQKASFAGISRYSASGFSIGNMGYVCLGWDINGNGLDDLWEYDPALNAWSAKSNFPGTARYNAVAFVVSNKAYVGLGYKPVQSDFYEYDPATNNWTLMANTFPGGARTTSAAFSCTYTIAGTTYEKGFVCTGSLDPDINSVLANDLWEFTPGVTPGSGTWLAKSSLPASGRYSSFAFSLNGKGYVGGGIGVGLAIYNDFFEYDPVTDTWAVKDSFPGINCVHARGFAVNNIGYAGSGQDLTTYYPYFYEYAPDNVPLVQLASSDTSFCEKQCLNFYDLSTNSPTSWQWYFPGADTSTSSVQNPTNICYNNYGSFDVTLIACNAAGCDTLMLMGFINEFQIPAPVIFQSNDTLYCSTGFAYQWWNVDSGIVAGATDSFFVPSQGGSYYVIVTDSNGCEGASNTIIITSVNEHTISKLQVAIIPNPNKGSFEIKLNVAVSKDLSLRIVNSLGQDLSIQRWSASDNQNNLKVETGKITSGIYNVEVISNHIIYHGNFIAE